MGIWNWDLVHTVFYILIFQLFLVASHSHDPDRWMRPEVGKACRIKFRNSNTLHASSVRLHCVSPVLHCRGRSQLLLASLNPPWACFRDLQLSITGRRGHACRDHPDPFCLWATEPPAWHCASSYLRLGTNSTATGPSWFSVQPEGSSGKVYLPPIRSRRC